MRYFQYATAYGDNTWPNSSVNKTLDVDKNLNSPRELTAEEEKELMNVEEK